MTNKRTEDMLEAGCIRKSGVRLSGPASRLLLTRRCSRGQWWANGGAQPGHEKAMT